MVPLTIVREMGGTCCMNGREEKRIYGFVGNPVGNRLLTRHSGRWEDTTKMCLKEIGRECVKCIHEDQK